MQCDTALGTIGARHVRAAARNLIDVVFPPTCPGCDCATRGSALCGACQREIVEARSPLCPICGIPFFGRAGSDHACQRCLEHRPSFFQARAVATYDGAQTDNRLSSALFRYKYGREVVFARPLGALLSARCPLAASYDVIMPVPLHVERLRWRGFNQALLLARPLARRVRVRIDPFALPRTRATPPQVGLDERSRRRNMARAFAVTDARAVRGRSILLVDDVMTTGATLNECARTLQKAGARVVDALVLARVL
jgi:ComF family protein